MSLIDELRMKTYYEANELLDIYGKACIIRPTGFGKTGILTRFIKSYTEKAIGSEVKVLFLYPSDPVLDAVLKFYYNTDDTSYRKIPNVRCMTYMSLINMTNSAMSLFTDVDLIITDECHLTGATETSVALKRLLMALPNAKLLGATATPIRMDEFDIVSYFYDNRVVSEYSLSDAFEDEVIQRPYYCYCSYAIDGDLKEIKKNTLKQLKGISPSERKKIMDSLEAKFIEVAKISKMDRILKTTLDSCAKDTSYMKGIFFFKNHNHLKEAKHQVVDWFKKAYPKHKIRVLVVATDSAEHSNNRFKLDKLSYQEKTVDIICAVNILNLGYHVNDLTFIGMFRGTKSATLFAQQLGRALSTGSINSCIVFDLVDNLHSKALTQALDKRSDADLNLKARYLELKEKVVKGSDEDLSALSEDEKEEYILLKNIFKNTKYPKLKGISSSNKIYREDLIATHHQATINDMLNKIVNEPKELLCKQAYNLWKEYGGDDSGGTAKYICDTCLNEGMVPITPFCALKGVSLEEVLKVVYGSGNYKEMVDKHIIEAKKKRVLVKI